jgi:HAE1 family hydrophobic/amphiphilic exporter-1
MPDVTYPTITVRVGYGGVGPAEIEQLIVRPLEQTLAAVPGLEQMNSTASEGSGNVRLNFAWGTNLNEAADEIRTRIDRVPRPIAERIRSAEHLEVRLGRLAHHGHRRRGRLRPRHAAGNGRARHRAPPRACRRRRVRHGQGGLRRQIHVELSKEKITALDLSVDRVVSTIRSEKPERPLGEILEATRTTCCAAPVSSAASNRSAT